MPDGSLFQPQLFEDLTKDPHGVQELLEAGVSARGAAAVINARSGTTRGTSSSSVSRRAVAMTKASRSTLMSRRFENEPIVAVAFDGTAIGRTGDKRTVMVAVGITADGRKLGLGVGIAQHEHNEDIYPIVEDLVSRGLDPRVLWITDGGSGIRKALKKLTRPEAPRMQLCTTHAARNAAGKLPEELQKPIRRRMYGAWAEPDADVAVTKLQTLAEELREQGKTMGIGLVNGEKVDWAQRFASAANSIRGSIDAVTVIRLGVPLEARKQIRSTNLVESVNSSIKKTMVNVTNWKDDEMRLRWTAQAMLQLEKKSWTRLGEQRALVKLMEELMPERHDPEAILASLPPSLTVERVPVPFDEDQDLRELATEWTSSFPQARWTGSPELLERLGLQRGAAVDPEELMRAMRCRPKGAGTAMRAARISVERRDQQGVLVKEKVRGVIDLGWQLTASPAVSREWQGADAARRADIEAALTEAGAAAIERATSTTQPGHGLAGVTALARPSADGTAQELRVVGIVFAVARGKSARLGSPVNDAVMEAATARDAEDAAKEVLDEALRQPEEPQQSPAPTPAQPKPVSEQLLAGVRQRALEKAPRLIGMDHEELMATAVRVFKAAEEINAVEGEVQEWIKTSWSAAAREIAETRSSAPHGDLWHPLTRGARVVLGEERSQRLLSDAAYRFGLLEAGFDPGPPPPEEEGKGLAGLRPAIERVEAMALSTAVSREFERRALFEVAADPEEEEADPIEIVKDRTGSGKDPIDRYARALGPQRTEVLRRYAEAVTAELEGLDEATLNRLAEVCERSWSRFDPASEMALRRHERDRDETLKERLKTMREVGRNTAGVLAAERARDGSAFVDASQRVEVGKRTAKKHWDRLREIEKNLNGERDVEGGANEVGGERDVEGGADGVGGDREAAIYHAVHAIVRERAATEVEVEPEPAAPAPALEAVGPEAAFDLGP